MKKVIFCGEDYQIRKKFPNIDTSEMKNEDAYFVFEDFSIKGIEIYEYHGSFKFENMYIIYGHENIMIFNEFGELKVNKQTR